jgi:hypothetical protein
VAAGKAGITDLFRTVKVDLGGTEYTLRELSVKENDDCTKMAKQPDGTFDGRIMMRMMVLKSIADPVTKDTDLGELPQRLYLRLCDLVTDLNGDDVVEEEEGEDDAKNA